MTSDARYRRGDWLHDGGLKPVQLTPLFAVVISQPRQTFLQIISPSVCREYGVDECDKALLIVRALVVEKFWSNHVGRGGCPGWLP